MDPVVRGHQYGKACDAVLQHGKPLLHMVLGVHSQLGGTAARGHHHVFKGACLHQSRRVEHGVGRPGAESAHVRAGGVAVARDLSGGLGEVAAAPLVHIPAGFLAAVDHIFHIVRVELIFQPQLNQGNDVGCLGCQIFQHHMGRQVHVHVVGALDYAHQLVSAQIEALGVLLLHQAL